MTTKEYKRKSALLTKILRLEHWDNYARKLIANLLNGYEEMRKRQVELNNKGK